jgi:hypothetical protein
MTARAHRTAHATVLALTMLAPIASPASAHMMPAHQGTLNVLDTGVFAVISLPATILDIDDDHDGLLSSHELAAHEAWARAEVHRRVQISDGDRAGSVDFLQLTVEPDEHGSAVSPRSADFVVLMKVRFEARPSALRIATDLRGSTGAYLTIKAVRGAQTETVTLTPERPVAKVFDGATRASLSGLHVAFGLLVAFGIGLASWSHTRDASGR